MQRREFITLLGGAAAVAAFYACAAPGQMRRIGVLMNVAADDHRVSGVLRLFW